MDARTRSALRLACAALAVAACAPAPVDAPAPDAAARATEPETGYRLVPPSPAAQAAADDSVLREIERLPEDAWEAATFRSPDGIEIPYRLLRPAVIEPGRRYPLVVVLHGSGEIGTDNAKHLDRFPKSWARREMRDAFPAFVVAPQMPARSANYEGGFESADRVSVPAPPMFAALALVDSLAALPEVDPARVYAVGFSMGASTVWNALAARPDRFAAAAPIAGVPPRGSLTELARTPLWIVHGNRDAANPIAPGRAAYPALAATPGARVRFWEMDGGEHRVPPALLAGDALPRWLFAHRKPAAQAAP